MNILSFLSMAADKKIEKTVADTFDQLLESMFLLREYYTRSMGPNPNFNIDEYIAKTGEEKMNKYASMGNMELLGKIDEIMKKGRENEKK